MVTQEQLSILLRGAFAPDEIEILATNKEFQEARSKFDGTPKGFSQLKTLGGNILTGGTYRRLR